jgi:Predicted membrane protein
MSENECPQCGAPVAPGTSECKYCGEIITTSVQPQNQQPAYQQPTYQQSQNQQQTYQQQNYQQPAYSQQLYGDGIDPSWPIKSKVVAGILGIFLGGLGIHKFYLGKIGMGLLYLLFCWTTIPAFIGFIEGIVYLASNDHNFQVKHRVRLQ